jgi:hypothetical protein
MTSSRARGALGALLLALAPAAAAQDGGPFAAEVSPPRLSLRADPGERLREVLDIANAGERQAEYRVRSADWVLSETGGLRFFEEALAPQSCRPWLRLERPRLRLAPQQRHRYRFEVHVPEEAVRQECRLAILVEQPDQAPVIQGPLTIPIAGRIAVIVYVAVGGAAPVLELRGLRAHPEDPQRLLVQTHNAGDAHGRFASLLEARDADGQRYRVELSTIAVLGGQTRELDARLLAPDGRALTVPPRYPLDVRGELLWDGGRIEVNETLVPTPSATQG